MRTTFNLGAGQSSNAGDTSWGYDALGQVLSVAPPGATAHRAYQFDTIGNRLQGSAGVPPASTETTYIPNALSQYQTITMGALY